MRSSLAPAALAGILTLLGSSQSAAAASGETAGLLIDVSAAATDATDLRLEERYVAVVPVIKPWREPLTELVVPADSAILRIDVPAGRYRAVCSATRRGLDFLPVFEVVPGEEKLLRCEPSELATLRSRVVDAATGDPVAGARVAPLSFSLEESPLRLSDLGMEHLARTLVASSDERGDVVLVGERGGAADYWITAPGYAPAHLEDVEFRSSSGELPAVRLVAGGSLTIAISVPGGFPDGEFLIALRRRPPPGGTEPGAGGGAVDSLIYRTSFRSLPASRAVRYGGLRTGVYEVWLRPRLHSHRTEAPELLGVATVNRGGSAKVEAVLPMTDPSAAGDAGELTVLVTGAVPADASALAARRWGRRGARSVPVTAEPVSGGLLARLRLSLAEGSGFQLSSPDAVTPRLEPGEGSAATTIIEASLSPAVSLRGELLIPPGLELPGAGIIEAGPCEGSGSQAASGDFPFAVNQHGAWSARVPAGCFRATLRAEGFAPLPLGTLEPELGGSTDLGRQRLEPAATLLARCLSGSDGRPVEGIPVLIIEPERVAGLVADWLESGGGEAPAEVADEHRSSSGPQGWARFSELSTGRYRLLALAPDGAMALSGELTLRPGAETTVYELELQPPAAVEVVVEGSTALPGDAGLVILATGAATCDWLAETVIERRVEDGATASVGPLPAERWSFSLLLDDAEAGSYEIARRTVALEPGALHRLTLAIEGSLFAGEVGWLGEPVAAELRFRSRAEGSRGSTVAATRSREDGSFSVLLPEPGVYDVDVWEEGGPGEAPRRTLVAEVPFDDPAEWLEIELPGGAIAGGVVDERGVPLAGAAVVAQQLRDLGEMPLDGSVRSGAGGEFRLERLTPGRWTVRAHHAEGRSESLEVDLAENEIRGGVRLTVRRGTVLEARVVAGGRPVAGAAAWVSCLWTGPADQCGGVARTDGDGVFTLDLGETPDPAQVNVLVVAPGLPLAAFRVAAGRSTVDLPLPAVGGRLTLTRVDRPLTETSTGTLVLADGDGALVPGARGSILADERGSGAGALVFPSLAPGSWRLYRVGDLAALERLQRSGGAGLPALATFELPPGGSVEVRFDGAGR